jgi:hypothetical protein
MTPLQLGATFATALQEFRRFVLEGRHTKEGVTCPCCDRLAKVYRRSINGSSLPFLKGLYVLDHRFRAEGREGVYFKSGKEGEKELITAGGDYSKMEWWGLIERERVQRKDGSWRSGYWRITLNGRRFLEKTISVPRYVYEYDGKPLNPQPEGIKFVTIDELDPEFNLQEIL